MYARAINIFNNIFPLSHHTITNDKLAFPRANRSKVTLSPTQAPPPPYIALSSSSSIDHH